LRMLKILLVSVVGLTAGACTYQDYITDASDPFFYQKEVEGKASIMTAEKADWSKADKVSVKLTPYGFTPGVIRLKQGQPYNLVIENTPENFNVISSDDFFDNIVVNSLSGHVGSLAEKRVGQLYFDEGQSRTMEIIPMKEGRFSIKDNRWGVDIQPWNYNFYNHFRGNPKISVVVESASAE
jgi:hypothetical protein